MLVSSFSLPHEHRMSQPSPAVYHDGPVFRACSSAMQRPTLTGVRIRSTRDANSIFYAVARNLLPMTVRRLDAEERRAITSGNVYVWEERGSSSEATGLGIERWTDGMRWSPSRVRDEFLFYHQKELEPEEAAELPPTRWARIVRPKASGSDASTSDASPDKIPSQTSSNDPERLIKQTYSVLVDFPEDRHRGAFRKWHLTAYFTQATVEELSTVDEVLPLPRVPVPDGLFRSARAGKNRRDNGRQRPSMGQVYDIPVAGPSGSSPAMSVLGEQPISAMTAHPSFRKPNMVPSPSHFGFPHPNAVVDARMQIDPPLHAHGSYSLPADNPQASRRAELELDLEESSRYRLEQDIARRGAVGVAYNAQDGQRVTPPLPPLRTSTTSLPHSRMHSPTYTHHPYLASPRPLSRGGAIAVTTSPRRGSLYYTQTASPSFALSRQPYPCSPQPNPYFPARASEGRHPRHISSVESLQRYNSQTQREHGVVPRDCDEEEVSPIQRESEVGPARGSTATPSPIRSRKTSLVKAFGPGVTIPAPTTDATLPVPPVSGSLQEVSPLESAGSIPHTRAPSPVHAMDEEDPKTSSEDSPDSSPLSSDKVILPPLTALTEEQADAEKKRLLVPLDSLDGATYPRRDPTDDALLRRFHALQTTVPAVALAPGAGEE